MHPFVERVAAQIRRHELLVGRGPVLVGLSGGADSVVLADVLLELGYDLHAVHVNYGLRGEASAGDEAFVRAFCERRGIPLIVRNVDAEVLRSEPGVSVQEAARNLRYDRFHRVSSDAGITAVALGHHRDDQVETVLLNLFRGAGPEGLAGMPVKRPIAHQSRVYVVRPLLDEAREDIETYAAERGLDWREDETNIKTVYRRGAVRAEILPLIERHFGPSVGDSIARSAGLMREYVKTWLDHELEGAFERSLREIDGGGSVDVPSLREITSVLRRRVLIEAVRRWLPEVEVTFERAAELEDLLASQPGRRLVYGGGEVWRERSRLLFVPPPAEPEGHDEPIRLTFEMDAPIEGGLVRAERLAQRPSELNSGSPNVVYLDAASLEMPLLVRRWRPGDRFSPLGMAHSKKISDFLTDERVPPHARSRTYVVESGGRIVWVVGHRISEDARVRGDGDEDARVRGDRVRGDEDDEYETVRLSFRPLENPEPRPS